MGSSDTNSMPVLIFAVIYLGFITIMLASIEIGNAPPDEPENQLAVLSMIDNLKTNTISLGYWNFLIYAPIITALIYIGIALATPSWA